MMKIHRITLVVLCCSAVLLCVTANAANGTARPLWVTGAFGTTLNHVDSTTGTLTAIGSTGYNGVVVLAFHPDGRLFTFTESGTTDVKIPEQLAVFDPVTGHATQIGSPLPERTRIMPATFGPDGTLYAAGIAGSMKSKLLVVDTHTGQPVVVGPFGVDGIMAFSFNRDGTLFGAAGSGLYRIDTATGHATLVTPFTSDLVGNGGSKGVMGIHFADDGTLFATDFVVGGKGSSLFRVDPTTGAATRVAYLGVEMSHSLAVAPPTRAERADRLIALAESFGGPAESLLQNVRPLSNAIASGRSDAGCGILSSFRTGLRGPSGQGLSSDQAGQLDLNAAWAESSLDCSPLRGVIVPIVGSTQGMNGRAFNTTASIANPGEAAITGNLVFHPAGTPSSASDPVSAYALQPHQKQTLNLMASFGVGGIGSLEIVPQSGPAPASSVTIDDSDNVVIVPAADAGNVLTAGSRAVLIAPSDLNRFRINVGFRTFSAGATFQANLYDAAGTLVRSETYSLPANYSTLIAASNLTKGSVEPDQSIVLMIQAGSMVAYASKAANNGNASTLELLRRIE